METWTKIYIKKMHQCAMRNYTSTSSFRPIFIDTSFTLTNNTSNTNNTNFIKFIVMITVFIYFFFQFYRNIYSMDH